jgi:hypothetical protein
MTPAITHSFASKKICPGDTWKVYLRAFDPGGDMKDISCIIDQAGSGTSPVSFTRIPEGQQRELSGYLFFNTAGGEVLNFASLILRVQIQDRAKNQSDPVSFPLTFNPMARQENPPAGIYQDRKLGPIMIRLRLAASGP